MDMVYGSVPIGGNRAVVIWYDNAVTKGVGSK